MSTKANKVDQLNCREYLVGGNLKKWDGDTSEVYSTISSDPNKPYSQTLLGSIPDMGLRVSIRSPRISQKSI